MLSLIRLASAVLAVTAVVSGAPSRKRSDPTASRFEDQIAAHFGHIDIPASFDYIVVGGGTAGLTVARRLADKYSVAVIEAGDFYETSSGNLSTTPSDAVYYLGKDPAFHNPLLDWGQKTTPQPGFGGGRKDYAQGRTFGGSSARNLMNYQRGSIGSYQKWADAVGDQSFSWNNLLPYFRKSVEFTPAPTDTRPANSTPKYNSSSFSPSGGPVQVTYPNWANYGSPYVIDAYKNMGFSETAGMVDGNLLGYGWIPSSMDPGQQARSGADYFLFEAIEQNANLVVYHSTLAKKIVFDGSKKAIGVQLESGGLAVPSVFYQLNATKEVIVSAGSLRSPQILMASGVGPAATLQEHNIPVVADKPGVGQNMWDQTLFGVTSNTNVLTHGWLGNPEFAAVAAEEYNTKHQGIMTNPGADILAFEKIPSSLLSKSTRTALDSTFGADWPDVEYISLDAYGGQLNDYLLGAPALKNYTTIDVVMVAPFSRGNVTIRSSDTKVRPIVNPNWFSDPRDLEVAVAAFKRARMIQSNNGMKPIIVGQEANPGPSVQTDDQIREFITNNSDTIHHAAGTCKMGKASDAMAVVDSHGRVFGVQGLRVADASIFALLPPGQPMATVYAVGEKIADDILTGN